MQEGIHTIENAPEHIPTLEEVITVLEHIVGGKPYEEIIKVEDEKGLYKFEVRLKEVDAKGGITEYWYKRDGSLGRNRSVKVPDIIEFFVDSDGMPSPHGSSSKVKFDDGAWYSPIMNKLPDGYEILKAKKGV